jgi:hypothetical protein
MKHGLIDFAQEQREKSCFGTNSSEVQMGPNHAHCMMAFIVLFALMLSSQT